MSCASSDLRQRAASFRGRLPEHRRATPPPEQGRRLLEIPRPKDDEEIRISWAEYEGHPYPAIRFWCKGDDGQFWPDEHRGFGVRLREIPDVAEAIAEALELADRHLAERPRQPARRDAPRPAADGSVVPTRQAINEAFRPSRGFDEFNH
jgi:hypothetical protein